MPDNTTPETTSGDKITLLNAADKYMLVPVPFNFKSSKTKGEDGTIRVIPKHPSISIKLSLITFYGLFEMVNGIEEALAAGDKAAEKQAQMLLDQVNDLIVSQAKVRVGEAREAKGEEAIISAEDVVLDGLSLEDIALLEPAKRGASAIPKETWDAFFLDWATVMKEVAGKSEDKIANQIKFLAKPVQIRANKPMLEGMLQLITLYAANTANIEDFDVCVARLEERFKSYLEEKEQVIDMSMV